MNIISNNVYRIADHIYHFNGSKDFDFYFYLNHPTSYDITDVINFCLPIYNYFSRAQLHGEFNVLIREPENSIATLVFKTTVDNSEYCRNSLLVNQIDDDFQIRTIIISVSVYDCDEKYPDPKDIIFSQYGSEFHNLMK
jgi:hypothetical protein